MIYSGKLDQRVDIQTQSITQNAYGEAVISYSTLATVWAEVMPATGREVLVSSAIYASAELKVRIRYRADFDEKARLLIDSVAYDVIHIADYKRLGERVLMVRRPS